MDLKEAKQMMRVEREMIKQLKKDRMEITADINARKTHIQNIKGAIFRGEIK